MSQSSALNPDGQISSSMIKNEFIKTGFSNLQSSLKDSFERLFASNNKYNNNAINDSVYSVDLNQRVFLDFGSLLQIPAYSHFKPSTLYKRIRICWNCFQVYSKIDIVRQQNLLKQLQKQQKKIRHHDPLRIEKDYESQTTLTSVYQNHNQSQLIQKSNISDSLSINQKIRPQLYHMISPTSFKNQKLNKRKIPGAMSMTNIRSQSQFSRAVTGSYPKKRLSKVQQTNLISNLLFKGQYKNGSNENKKLTKTTFNLNKITSLLKDVDQTTKKLSYLQLMADMYKEKELALSGSSPQIQTPKNQRISTRNESLNRSSQSKVFQDSISPTALNWLDSVQYDIKQYKKVAPNFRTQQKEIALKKKNTAKIKPQDQLIKRERLNRDIELDEEAKKQNGQQQKWQDQDLYNSNQSPIKQQRSHPIKWNDDDQFPEPQLPILQQETRKMLFALQS